MDLQWPIHQDLGALLLACIVAVIVWLANLIDRWRGR